MPPPTATAAICVPSAAEAIHCQFAPGALDGVHVNPPFVEAQILPKAELTTAASRIPSADDAMETQLSLGALVCVHVVPLFVEV